MHEVRTFPSRFLIQLRLSTIITLRTDTQFFFLPLSVCLKVPHRGDSCMRSAPFFFFINLGPVWFSSGSTSAFKAYCTTLNSHQHRFIIPVSLMKRQRSLSEVVLISFGSINGLPQKIVALSSQCLAAAGDNAALFQSPSCRICRMDLHWTGPVQYHSMFTVLLLATGRWATTEWFSTWFPIDRTIQNFKYQYIWYVYIWLHIIREIKFIDQWYEC
jgi:hypothetical protein